MIVAWPPVVSAGRLRPMRAGVSGNGRTGADGRPSRMSKKFLSAVRASAVHSIGLLMADPRRRKEGVNTIC
jgi:hypothetical protein